MLPWTVTARADFYGQHLRFSISVPRFWVWLLFQIGFYLLFYICVYIYNCFCVVFNILNSRACALRYRKLSTCAHHALASNTGSLLQKVVLRLGSDITSLYVATLIGGANAAS